MRDVSQLLFNDLDQNLPVEFTEGDSKSIWNGQLGPVGSISLMLTASGTDDNLMVPQATS